MLSLGLVQLRGATHSSGHQGERGGGGGVISAIVGCLYSVQEKKKQGSIDRSRGVQGKSDCCDVKVRQQDSPKVQNNPHTLVTVGIFQENVLLLCRKSHAQHTLWVGLAHHLSLLCTHLFMSSLCACGVAILPAAVRETAHPRFMYISYATNVLRRQVSCVEYLSV